MSINPWSVNNIKEFLFLNCPECAYKTKVQNKFQDHAIETHPLSCTFFGANTTDIDEANIFENFEKESPKVESIEQEGTNFLVKLKDSNKEKQSPNNSTVQNEKTLEEIMFPDFETELPADELCEVEQTNPSIGKGNRNVFFLPPDGA